MFDQNILSSAEVAPTYTDYLTAPDRDTYEAELRAEVARLRGLLEKEQAEVIRLLELFALTPHVAGCSTLKRGRGLITAKIKCNCIKSEVNAG